MKRIFNLPRLAAALLGVATLSLLIAADVQGCLPPRSIAPIETTVATTDAARLAEIEAELVREANAARLDEKRRPLRFESAQTSGARETARRNAFERRARHYGPPCAEICAAGYASPRAAVRGWLQSPDHRAILLGGRERVSAGVAFDGDGRLYCVLRFW
ncbi:MAG: CAP domain-containing protein [Thermoguttaceae bacterium]|nr:CAP domain-containing protein [Thermoguttaceae bacterium]MBR4104547.1 CAP domain-containing protein [Thermoguttaceae bacterium]